MTDRELLELAAKAVGIEVWWNTKDGRMYRNPNNPSGVVTGVEWNPLTDEGDRYKLARTCKLIVDFDGGGVKWQFDGEEYKRALRFTPGDETEEAYTIGRAAAEIGRNMK